MSGVDCHSAFVMACEDMIAAIENEAQQVDGMTYIRLKVACHMVHEGLRYGRAASRLIAGDTSVETYDKEIDYENH